MQVVGALAAGALRNGRTSARLRGASGTGLTSRGRGDWHRVAGLVPRRSATGPGDRLSARDSPLERGSASRGRPGSALQCNADQAPDSKSLTRRDPPPRRPYLSLGGSRGQAASRPPSARVLSPQGGSALVSAIRIGAGFWIEDIYCVNHLPIHSDYLPSLFSNAPSTQS